MTVPSSGRLIGRPLGASLVEREVRTGVEAGGAGEGSFALGLCPDQSRQINHLQSAEVLAKDRPPLVPQATERVDSQSIGPSESHDGREAISCPRFWSAAWKHRRSPSSRAQAARPAFPATTSTEITGRRIARLDYGDSFAFTIPSRLPDSGR